MQPVYARLPNWLQPAAIWAYGWHLRRARYGGVYRTALGEFAERDGYSEERWREHQDAALKSLLRHAVTRVPFYRELHAAGRYPVEEVRSVADLPVLPAISKWEVYERPEAFLAEGVRRERLLAETTSGTTGTPLTLYVSRETNQRWYAATTRRMLQWQGVAEGLAHATFGARPAVPLERERPPYWRYNPVGKQLYVPVQHLTRTKLDAVLDALRRYRVRYLYGYGSSLGVLARHALETGRDDLHLDAAFSNAEPFFPRQRERVERAFRCRTADTYAASEKTFACFEYERTLYASPDIGVLEILRDDEHDNGGSRVADPGEVGEVCGTGLLNWDFVLIRYRQGDRAALGPAPKTGPVRMPVVERIDGRNEDALITPEGREVRWAGIVFKTDMRILEAQVAQVTPQIVEARVVPAEGYRDREDGHLIRDELSRRLGPSMHVRVRCVPEIPRLANGKFRTVLRECEIPGAGSRKQQSQSTAANASPPSPAEASSG